VTDVAEGSPAGEQPQPAPARRPRWLVPASAALGVAVLVVVVAVLLGGGGSGSAPPDGAADIIPADALAYVNLSTDGGAPPVRQALAVARRFPDFPLGAGAVLVRLASIVAGGRSADYARQIRPWLGSEASLALLDTTTSTAGSLVILDVRDVTRARAFTRAEGATSAGSDRGRSLERYPNGNELAFLGHFLVIGQPASVRAAVDVVAGRSGSLAHDAVYRRASSGRPADRVLDAYASLAGVRRLLADQGGAIGAVGSLLYQPALQGVGLSVSPGPTGLTVRVHSALDPTLVGISPSANRPFAPALPSVMPAGASLMVDVSGLDTVAPRVLNAGSAAGVAGGLGPLLSRLGAALKAEGVNVADVISIFHGESAVAVVPHRRTPTLVIAARTADQARTSRALAALEAPLAQLFAPAGKSSSSAPVFNDRDAGAGVTAHQLSLTTGLQLDYAVFHGLVVISTSLQGISAVARHTRGGLASSAGFRSVLAHHAPKVTALVYADLAKLLSAGASTGLTTTLSAIATDLRHVGAVGLSSVSAGAESTAELSVEVPGR
jgi:hypothetical protein